MRRGAQRAALAGALLAACLAASSARAQATAVAGADRARLVLPAAAAVEQHHLAARFALRRIGRRRSLRDCDRHRKGDTGDQEPGQ